MKNNLLVIAAFYTLLSNAFAQTDTLKSNSLETVVNSVIVVHYDDAKADYVISAKEIEEHPASSVSELLNTIPNLHISETYGNAGSVQGYYSRGGRSKDVLIMINGIPMSDDSQISNFEDLNMIPKEQIERVEVTTTSSSTRYGSSASAGVINIILKNTTNSPLVQAKLQAGKWGSLEQFIQVGLKSDDEKVAGTVSFNTASTNGFSAAKDNNLTDNVEFDRDASNRYGLNATMNYQPIKNVKLELLGSTNQHKYDYDADAFTDGTNEQDNKKGYLQFNSRWDNVYLGNLSLKASTAKYNRKSDGFYNTQFDSKNINADLAQTVYKNGYRFIGGLYYKQTKANSFDNYSGTYMQTIYEEKANYKMFDPYLTINKTIQKLLLDAGGRYHTHNNYDNKFVYHGNVRYEILENYPFQLKVRGGVNTSFNTPSLYQTYAPLYGNKELKPEEFFTIEGGLDAEIQGKLNLSATYFEREGENEIVFFTDSVTFASNYVNTDKKHKAKGLEAKAMMQWNDYIHTSAFYAKTKLDDKTLFYKQPKDEFGAGLTVNTKQHTGLVVNYRRVGERLMKYFPPPTYILTEQPFGAYNMLNVTVSQQFWEQQVRFYINANNILNEDFVDNPGYNSADFNMNIGATLRLN